MNCQWCQRIRQHNPQMLLIFSATQLHEGHEVVDEHLRFWASPEGQKIKWFRKGPKKPRPRPKV
jgi:hypothetical protein